MFLKLQTSSFGRSYPRNPGVCPLARTILNQVGLFGPKTFPLCSLCSLCNAGWNWVFPFLLMEMLMSLVSNRVFLKLKLESLVPMVPQVEVFVSTLLTESVDLT